jgi:hypothetical protein
MKRFRTYIVEGGNAVAGVVPINQENSIATVKDVYAKLLPKLGLKESDVAMLGSTGKKAPKATSGDIDLALSAPKMLKSNKVNTYEDLMQKVIEAVKSLGLEYNFMRGLGIVSVAYPIVNEDGLQEGQTVQLDLMVVDSVELASWAYFSPSYLQSDLKGLYRNALIAAISKFMGHKTLKTDLESKEPIEWERYFYNMNVGLEFGKQTRVSAKTGKVVKTRRSFDKKTITNKPDEIVKYLFGDKYTANQILTFEDAYKAVMSKDFPHKSIRKKVFQEFAKTVQSKGYPVPKEVDKQI